MYQSCVRLSGPFDESSEACSGTPAWLVIGHRRFVVEQRSCADSTRVGDQPGPRTDIEFGHQPLNPVFDRPRAKGKALGDLLVVLAEAQEREDLTLSWGQQGGGRNRPAVKGSSL